MCIRDRQFNRTAIVVEEKAVGVAHILFCLVDLLLDLCFQADIEGDDCALCPVSYTHLDVYKRQRIIRRAAESRNPEDKTLMWFCRPHGTHCLNENQVFIQGTRDHNTFRFYAEQTYDE